MNSDQNRPEPARSSAPAPQSSRQMSGDLSGTGFLIVHVTTARGAIPLEGARVEIRSYDLSPTPDTGDVIASLVSGADGNTVIFPLPAPPRAESLSPGGPKPYASYVVEIFLEGYRTQTYTGIPIFDGITAIQPADLIPLPENGKPDSYTPDGESFFESAAPDL